MFRPTTSTKLLLRGRKRKHPMKTDYFRYESNNLSLLTLFKTTIKKSIIQY